MENSNKVALWLTHDELFELEWIFDSLLTTSLCEQLDSRKEIRCCSAYCVSPSRLLSIYKKLHVMAVCEEYPDKIDEFTKKFILYGK